MKKTKILLVLSCLLFSLSMLTACSSNKNDTIDKAPAATTVPDTKPSTSDNNLMEDASDNSLMEDAGNAVEEVIDDVTDGVDNVTKDIVGE